MDTKLFFGDATTFETPMLAVFAVDLAEGKDEDPSPALLTSDGAAQVAAAALLASSEFKAALGEVAVLHAPGGLKAERLLLVGLGKRKDLSLDRIRKGAGTAVRAAKPRSVRTMAIAFPDTGVGFSAALTARTLVEGAEFGQLD
jgi:leucyl aminopeptidase